MRVKKTFGFIHEYMKYFLYHENRSGKYAYQRGKWLPVPMLPNE